MTTYFFRVGSNTGSPLPHVNVDEQYGRIPNPDSFPALRDLTLYKKGLDPTFEAENSFGRHFQTSWIDAAEELYGFISQQQLAVN